MGDLRWLQFVEPIIAEFTRDSNRAEELRALLHETDWYDIAYKQFITGASERRVADLLRRALLDAGVTPDSRLRPKDDGRLDHGR